MDTNPVPAPKARLSPVDLRLRKGGVPIVCLTAYSTPMTRLIDNAVDLILVGDSLGMVVYGFETTVPVTLEMMIRHGVHAVARGARHACVILDLPFGTYQETPVQAYRNAARALAAETGAFLTISRRSRLVAQRTRTSTRNGSFSPTRRISPDSRNRSSLTWTLLSSSPTSSRNRVPPLATSKSPLRSRVGAGEGPLAVAEQLALDEVLGQGAAVDRDERVAGAVALVVEVPGDQLLAGAGLAQDHHAGVGRGDRVDQAADRLHRRGLADQGGRPLGGLAAGSPGRRPCSSGRGARRPG